MQGLAAAVVLGAALALEHGNGRRFPFVSKRLYALVDVGNFPVEGLLDADPPRQDHSLVLGSSPFVLSGVSALQFAAAHQHVAFPPIAGVPAWLQCSLGERGEKRVAGREADRPPGPVGGCCPEFGRGTNALPVSDRNEDQIDARLDIGCRYPERAEPGLPAVRCAQRGTHERVIGIEQVGPLASSCLLIEAQQNVHLVLKESAQRLDL